MRISSFLAVLLIGSGLAARNTRRFQLDYATSGSCASEAELVEQIVRSVPDAVRVSAEADVVAKLRIDSVDSAIHATLELRAPEGPSQREVTGNDCAEVTRALALIIALAIDPDAESREPAPVEAPAPAPNPAPSPPVVRAPPEAPPETSTSKLWYGAGAVLGVTGGVAPDLAIYEGGYFELGEERVSAFAPSFRLSGFHAARSTETESGDASFELLALRAAGCPLQTGSTWFARSCVTFDFGRLRGRGSATQNPKTASSLWYGPGASIELGWFAFGVLTLKGEAGVLAPLSHDRFFFGPDTTAHRIPSVAGYVGVGLGFRS